MEEDTNKVETPAQPSVHTVIRRINLPQHQLQAAIRQAVARNQVTEEEGQDILWLYSYCNENHLDERDVAPLVGFEKNTIYQVFRGMYQAASWRNVITGIRKFKTVMTNEMKRRDIGFILTSIADKIFKDFLCLFGKAVPDLVGHDHVGIDCLVDRIGVQSLKATAYAVASLVEGTKSHVHQRQCLRLNAVIGGNDVPLPHFLFGPVHVGHIVMAGIAALVCGHHVSCGRRFLE